MAETTDIKKFLDYVGVSKLWTNITNTFAPKWLAYRPNKTLERSEDDIKIKYESAGEKDGLGADILITLPVANVSEAGLLSAGDKGKIDSLGSSLSEASTYKSNIDITDNDLEMPNAVGGIAKGTKVSELNGKTYNQMFDDLLFPTINPTITGPSASLAIKVNSIREVGSAAPSSKDEFTVSFNRGSIVLLGVSQGERAGTKKSEIVYHSGYNPSEGTGTQFPSKIVLGENNYYCQVSYNESTTQPKDNKGNDYDSPLSAGAVTSSKCTIYGTYPIYATTEAINRFTPISLKPWSDKAITSSEVDLIDQPQGPASETTKQAFLVPYPSGRNTTVIIEWYNEQSNKWENHTSQFAKTDTTKSINGISVNYRYYYFNSTAGIGKRKFRITF